ncbi:MAG: beta-1,6-N-acetylglucosaminyltransferase [Lachnospiraceae bacterium]|nr:beta-1,6-N-acetylglucosaminyltransferase [Lachnospiraceae bacterium]
MGTKAINAKHAYLIMAHEYTDTLITLLKLLDDSRNDVFLHMDRKCTEPHFTEMKSLVTKAGLFFTKRYNISWGTNSMVLCEIKMLATAVKKGSYEYYHLLSGADLPLKNQDELHKWFHERKGKEFLHFGLESYQQDIASRYNVYHFFMKQIGRKRDKPFWLQAETYSLAIQRRLHIDRTRNLSFHFYGGAQWFSITDQCARYVVKHFKGLYSHFRFVQILDELAIQTIVMNSPFAGHLYMPGFLNDYMACARAIDWERGAPYCYRIEDFDELMSSGACFARKFDTREDAEIVSKIYDTLKK